MPVQSKCWVQNVNLDDHWIAVRFFVNRHWGICTGCFVHLDLDALTATIIHLIILPLSGGYVEIKTNFRQRKTYQ